jgi:hypothetical protein
VADVKELVEIVNVKEVTEIEELADVEELADIKELSEQLKKDKYQGVPGSVPRGIVNKK